MNETSYLNKLTKITQAYQDDDLSVESLNQQVEDLVKSCDEPSEGFFVQLQQLVQSSDLPPNVSESLLNKISQIESDYGRTEVVDSFNQNSKKLSRNRTNNKSFPETPGKNSEGSAPNMTGNSVLLQNLLSWHKAGQEKKIEPNVVIRDTYRLVSKIGEGGMGEVWKAIDLIQDAGDSRDRYVAIKFLNQEIQGKEFALKALVREFARYKKLIHPNLIRAFELNRDENLLFIVMEFLPGISLDKFIQNHPNGVSTKQAQPIIEGMCKALEYSHQEGIIHLDFKPSNVFYNPETDSVKVIDFGIARLAEKQDRDLTRFDPGILGAKTKAYATPEMMIDADPHPCDDVYGLSCVIYEVLTGKHPFKQLNVIRAEAKSLKPAPIKNLNKSQLKSLEKGLAFHRKDRTKNAGKLYQELYPKSGQKNWQLSRKGIIAAIVVIAIIVAPILNHHIGNWQLQGITNGIKKLDANAIEKFHNLDTKSQSKIAINEAIGQSLVKYFISVATPEATALDHIQKLESHVQDILLHKKDNRRLLVTHSANLIDQAIQDNKFDLASEIANHFVAKYPDSKQLANQVTLVINSKNEQLLLLKDKFNQCLQDTNNNLINLSSCLSETANQLNHINPNLNIINSPQLSNRFIKETNEALATNNFHSAEKLLSLWEGMLPIASEKRIELSAQLEQKMKLEIFTSQILAADDIELERLIRNLLAANPLTKKMVLSESKNHEKLKNWYQEKVQELINSNKYNAISTISSQAKNLFSDDRAMHQWIKELEQNVATSRRKSIQALSERYNTVLRQEALDAKALQEIHQKVQEIDPENNLLAYPHVRETYLKKTTTALNHGQFDLAERYLQDWRMLRPEDAETDSFKMLSTRRLNTLNIVQKRNDMTDKLRRDLNNKSFDQALDKVKSLHTSFTDDDRKFIMESIKITFLQSLSEQVETKIQRNDYNAAIQLTNIAFQNYPDEQAVKTEKAKINADRTKKIEIFLSNYRALLEADLLQGTELFNQLKSIYLIDKGYISNHPGLFKALSNRLKELMSTNPSLTDLKNVLVQWQLFLEKIEDSSQNDTLLESTKNYVALQCLFKAKLLKNEGELTQASTYLNFGLSLNPSDRIKNSLNEEMTN